MNHWRLLTRQIYLNEDYLSHHDDGSDNLHSSISDVQANVNEQTTQTKIFSLPCDDQGHDDMSGSQLCFKQHNDPEISPLFKKPLNEDEISKEHVCYHTNYGILMRKWRPPDV